MPIHIHAGASEIAPLVLLPGDPDRARLIAEQYLDDPQCYNKYRQLLGFTGSYRGLRLSVQSTGMGAPSAAIVMHELISLGAERFLRIGSCGALDSHLALGDILLVDAALANNGATRSLLGLDMNSQERCPATAEFNEQLLAHCHGRGVPLKKVLVATEDLFYHPDAVRLVQLVAQQVSALEMEASVIFALAAQHDLHAAAMLMVSDLVQSAIRMSAVHMAKVTDRLLQTALDAVHGIYGPP